MATFRRKALAASVMTALTLLAGGVGSAAAAPITLGFSLDTTTDLQSFSYPELSGNGQFSLNDSAAVSPFQQFNDLGGSLILTSVTVSVLNDQANLSVDISGNLDVSGNAAAGADAENASTFSVNIGLGGGGGIGVPSGSPQPLSVSVLGECVVDTTVPIPIFPSPCHYGESDTNTTSVPFSITFTSADPELALFVGGGSFDITPMVELGGQFSWDTIGGGTVISRDAGFSARTTWSGDIQVEYAFREVPTGIPEPATLLLVGAGLAGLGVLRRSGRSTG